MTRVTIAHLVRLSFGIAAVALVLTSAGAASARDAPAGIISYISQAYRAGRQTCLFVAALDQPAPRRLLCGPLGRWTEDLVDDEALSPDGDWLAFTESGGKSGVYVVEADGKGLQRLVVTHESAYGRLPPRISQSAWSRNSTRLAFDRLGRSEYRACAKRQPFRLRITVASVSPRSVVEVPALSRVHVRKTLGDIGWSPSGDSLLYTVNQNSDQYCELSSSSLYTIGTDGQRRRLLASAPDISAAWSPDGSAIAYITCVRRSTSCALYTIDLDDLQRHLVGRYAGYRPGHPMWMPSGNAILVQGDVVSAFDVTTGHGGVVARAAPDRCFGPAEPLAVSPDSQWIGVVTDADWYFTDCKDNPYRAVISFVSPEGTREGSIAVPVGKAASLDSVSLSFR